MFSSTLFSSKGSEISWWLGILQLNILCLATGKWTTQKHQYRRHFQGKEIVYSKQIHIINYNDAQWLHPEKKNEQQSLDHSLIAPLVSSWLITFQKLFRTCFRWSLLSTVWRYTVCYREHPELYICDSRLQNFDTRCGFFSNTMQAHIELVSIHRNWIIPVAASRSLLQIIYTTAHHRQRCIAWYRTTLCCSPIHCLQFWQKRPDQLLAQRGRAMFRVVQNFAATQGHSNWHR